MGLAERYVIQIVHAPFAAGFDVKVTPAPAEENLDATFPDHRRASRWADGLRRTRGWRIIDRTGLADLHRVQA
ncbi:hypothetical protein EWH10_06385 [Sphingobium fuliginis]|uniref:Uncharacterized protein n=1 Tax=Sphingobium fuliginis (strain ATCC 27551) TaxID=336203 RepID=A0ABQ1ESC9_SPHSA|nr:hypothetical protein EWH10_06385 [Sphingobium fuliginis]GFZ85168.1 hypothetical protein GCM10019071_12750 [Sphingobium fuliginis]